LTRPPRLGTLEAWAGARRAAEDGLIYHVLNRANARTRIFEDAADYEAFLWILDEARKRWATRPLACCPMPNHWHLVLWPVEDAELSRYAGWPYAHAHPAVARASPHDRQQLQSSGRKAASRKVSTSHWIVGRRSLYSYSRIVVYTSIISDGTEDDGLDQWNRRRQGCEVLRALGPGSAPPAETLAVLRGSTGRGPPNATTRNVSIFFEGAESPQVEKWRPVSLSSFVQHVARKREADALDQAKADRLTWGKWNSWVAVHE
jgi:REP element-mobilizing transposase RayT